MDDDGFSRAEVTLALLLVSRFFFFVVVNDRVEIAVSRTSLARFALAETTEIVVHVVEIQVPGQDVAVFVLGDGLFFGHFLVVRVPIRMNVAKVPFETNKLRAPALVGGLEEEFLLI